MNKAGSAAAPILERQIERLLRRMADLEAAGDYLYQETDAPDLGKIWPGFGRAVARGLIRETAISDRNVYGCAYHLTDKGRLAIGGQKEPHLAGKFTAWVKQLIS